ncbi:hypothetical protein tb265_06940 [Gemmatimonadetes bacterium T265]|nr:hypothetical protein tb265_06940 [Gemmatimonadetes bacterium T265]
MAAVLAACGGSGGADPGGTAPPPAPAVAAVRITNGRAAQLDEQGTVTLAAQAQTSAGAVVPNVALTWTALDPGVASVSAAGLVAAVTPGTAHIVVSDAAAAGAPADTATVTVVALPVAVVAVADTALPAALAVGDTGTVTATPRAAGGRPLSTANGRAITWAVDDPRVATVSATGVVTARAVGATAVRATSGGQTGVATLRVAANPFRIVLTVDVITGPVSADVVAAARLAIRRWEHVVGSGSTAAPDAQNPQCAAVASLAPGQYALRLRVGSAGGSGHLAEESADCTRIDYQVAAGTTTVDTSLARQAVVGGAPNPLLLATLAHEIGHALGIGSWTYGTPGGLVDLTAGTFTGAQAARAWQALGGAGDAPLQVPTYAHWRADATTGLCGELMAPVVTPTSALSALTLAALVDLGWTVRADRAEPYARGGC